MKARKTLEVEQILQFANEQLAHPNNTLEEKLGIITMIEFVLSKADRYRGFMFLHLDGDNTAPRLGTSEWCCRKYF
jgi:hypothetical protein